MSGAPVDFSFKDLCTVEGENQEYPYAKACFDWSKQSREQVGQICSPEVQFPARFVQLLHTKVVSVETNAENVLFSTKDLTNVLSEEPNKGVHAPWSKSEGKFASRVLRLNNNLLANTTGLMETLSALFTEPKRLAWLDLSFNNITHIHPVLTELVELRVLYLHGNSVCNLSEVDKLGALPLLHTITLHGNNIEPEHGYRNYVIATLPHLKMMDFSGVTKQERAMASIWQRPKRRRKPTNRHT